MPTEDDLNQRAEDMFQDRNILTDEEIKKFVLRANEAAYKDDIPELTQIFKDLRDEIVKRCVLEVIKKEIRPGGLLGGIIDVDSMRTVRSDMTYSESKKESSGIHPPYIHDEIARDLRNAPFEPKVLLPGSTDPDSKQNSGHWVLSDEELAKGYLRPLRRSYVHEKCGTATSMPDKIAKTYAVNPKFYSKTFCVHCQEYRPVDEFIWGGIHGNDRVGS